MIWGQPPPTPLVSVGELYKQGVERQRRGGGNYFAQGGDPIAIYAPMIYTASYVMFLMRADPLRGQVRGGWALEIKTFLGPVKWHRVH